jgi:hypothetical protein
MTGFDAQLLGAARYRFLAYLYTARWRLYTSTFLVDRVRAFCAIMSRLGYSPKRRSGLGPVAYVKMGYSGEPSATGSSGDWQLFRLGLN